MPDGLKRMQIVCYDITDRRRLARVHRFLKQEGLPMQYSVFLVHADKAAMSRLVSRLQRLINPKKDDLRVYPLPSRIDCVSLGRQQMPDGVVLISPGIASGLLQSTA